MMYDVAIVGAGLAGLSLAYQLLRNMPEISICLIHEDQFPNEDVAFKVGEATIELGGYYLRETLGLGEYMKREHFVKMGMRFIETSSDSYREMGVNQFPPNDSYQFERGKLENYIFSLIEKKVDIYQNTRFLDVEDRGPIKTIHVIELGKNKKILNSQWLIDASGRKKALSKQYNLFIKQPLPNSSVWFRVNGAVMVDDIYPADRNNPFSSVDRSYSSLHIDGKGYWIWVLRLSEHTTSVGIAFSENVYNMEEFSSLEKTFEWLKKHENIFYNYLKEKDFPILDFKYLRKYITTSLPCLSKDHWALTGDACIFLDPVYSGGLDTICIENTFITDVITKERQGIDPSKYIDFYNNIVEDLLDVYAICFNNMYEKKDNWYYIFAKYIIDSAMYFGGGCPFFMNEAIKDFDGSKKAWNIVHEMFNTYKNVIAIIQKENFQEYNIEMPRFINLTQTVFGEINVNLKEPNNDIEKLILLLEDNHKVLKKIYDYVSNKKNLIDLYFSKENNKKETNTSWRYEYFFPIAS